MKNKMTLIDIFKYYSRPYMGRFFTLGIAMVLQSLVKVALPIINGLVIDEIIYHQNLKVFFSLAKILGLVIVVSILLEFIITSGFWFTQLRFALDIRLAIMKKIYSAYGSFLSKMKSGDAVHTVNADTPQYMNVITDNIIESFCSVASCIFVFGYVGYISKTALFFILVLVPLTVFLSYIFGKISRRLSSDLRNQEGNFTSWVFEIIKGIRDIQLLSGETGVIKIFQQRYKTIIKLNKKINMMNLFSERSSAAVVTASEFAFYILGAYLVYRDKITIGSYITITSLLAVLNGNLSRLCNFFVLLQSRRASLERVQNYLNLPSESSEPADKDFIISKGEINFQNVSFSYNKNQLLKNINLQIPPGKKVAIVGKNGAGKSTLAYLLLRFYEPLDGEIKLDNIPIKNIPYKELRRSIGFVQQDVLIYNDSLRYNITLGENYSDSMIWEACRKAAIDKVIDNLPMGLETEIGKDGFNLSGGQRQRIAIARIILRNPPILILDEATASLDSESSNLVQQAWLSLSDKKTSIIIAHNLSSIINTDYVAVLENGKIIAFDHHAVLLENCPYYYDLFHNQYCKNS